MLAASVAQAQVYAADLTASEWKVSASPFACSLTHVIPVFGKAVFARKAASDETFHIETQAKINFPAGNTRIETFPPKWRNDVLPINLGSVTAAAGKQPISLNKAQTEPMVAQLLAGANVMYSSQTVATTSSSSSVVRVVLNARDFSGAYKKYQDCVANIIPYSFAQVARTSINYAAKPSGLTLSNKAQLNKVARYIKADPKVVGVFVDGHSDDIGTTDIREATSKQAAEWVTTYLTSQGIAADKITTRWHADKFLIANNKTDTGRARNRRVTVRLEDEATHKEFMKKEEDNRKAQEQATAEKIDAENKNAENKSSEIASTNDEPEKSSNNSSSNGRMTPEEISRMVEGFDLKKSK